jgi:hypothetical protein
MTIGVRGACIPFALLTALLLPPRRAFAADAVLPGALERLADGSIFIRLADGRLIDARLPHTADLAAESIAAHYSLADQVEITCKPIHAVYNQEMALHQHLELQKLKRLRPASPEERAQVLEHLARERGANLLKDSGAPFRPDTSAEAGALLAHVRQVNLEFVANLPNFVADETGKRYTATLTSKDWRYVDTIESQITFRSGQASREQIRLNSKAWDRLFLDLPGTTWGVFFGTQLRSLFSPACQTKIEFEGRETAQVKAVFSAGATQAAIEFEGRETTQGRELLAFRFTSPPASCFHVFRVGSAEYRPARTGRFLVDDPGGNVIRYEEEAIRFPEDFGADRHTVVESWAYVKIGDATHLLPVGVEITGRQANGSWAREIVTYKNHRHFETSTNLVFH